MAPTKIVFSDHNATPPVYVAGTFTSWQPIEIEPKQGEDGFTYEKTFEIAPGTHQYKFRLGPGDWWVCDNQAQKTADASGNENNEIVVKAEPVAKSEPIAKVQPKVKSEPETKPAPVPTSLISSATTVMNGTAEPKATKSLEPAETIVSPEAKPIETLESLEPKANGGVKAVAENAVPEQPVEKETAIAQTAPEPAKVISQPLNEKAEPETTPSPAADNSDSKGSSVSSIPPKEQVSGEKANEPKKLNWFSRIFLCGSSGKTMLAAIVVTVPLLAAYVIQK